MNSLPYEAQIRSQSNGSLVVRDHQSAFQDTWILNDLATQMDKGTEDRNKC